MILGRLGRLRTRNLRLKVNIAHLVLGIAVRRIQQSCHLRVTLGLRLMNAAFQCPEKRRHRPALNTGREVDANLSSSAVKGRAADSLMRLGGGF